MLKYQQNLHTRKKASMKYTYDVMMKNHLNYNGRGRDLF